MTSPIIPFSRYLNIRSAYAPVWLEDRRVRSVSPASIDKTTVTVDSGEMSFDMFDFTASTDKLVNDVEQFKNVLTRTLKI